MTDDVCTAWLAEWPNGRTHVLTGPPRVADGEMDGEAWTPELAIAWCGDA